MHYLLSWFLISHTFFFQQQNDFSKEVFFLSMFTENVSEWVTETTLVIKQHFLASQGYS